MHYICFCMACFFTYAYYYNLWVYKMGLLGNFLYLTLESIHFHISPYICNALIFSIYNIHI